MDRHPPPPGLVRVAVEEGRRAPQLDADVQPQRSERGPYAQPESRRGPDDGIEPPVEAFHVEIDTYHNQNDPFYEPGPSNHIAVTLNGDPADHVLLADGLNLELLYQPGGAGNIFGRSRQVPEGAVLSHQ